MNFKENVILALNGLKANKMRAFLTMLGIIIGISSVIMITTLGSVVQNGLGNLAETLGVNNMIQLGIVLKDDAPRRPEREDFFTMEMIENTRQHFGRKIKYMVVDVDTGGGKIPHRRQELSFSVDGTTPDSPYLNGMDILNGHFFTQDDVDRVRNVCVIPFELAEKLYGSRKNAVGKTLSLNIGDTSRDFTVVGVSKYKQTAFGGVYTPNYIIYIPYTVSWQMDGRTPAYTTFYYSAADGIDATALSKQIKNYIQEKYYKNSDVIEVGSYSLDEELAEYNQYIVIVQLVLSLIAGISLLVGGIGVMNIMLVSVTERTREIGVRKALGAPNSAIRIQFIVESVIICSIGGAIGIIFGILLGNIGGIILKQPAIPSVPAIIIAVTFSMAIGVFFGYYPANKAAKLDPIEALRYE